MHKLKEILLYNRMFLKSGSLLLLVGFLCSDALADEMYIISTRNGSEIIVKNYRFTEEHVEFTFLTPGSAEDYLCGPHWERRDMIGRVTVVE